MKNRNFIHSSFFSYSKRIIDLFITCIILPLYLPFFIVLWLTSLWQIGYPIIFKQKRAGKNGKEFTIYKFRTMVKNAESLRSRNQEKFAKLNYAPKPMFKIENDPRFTKFGKVLSKTGLDELPQIINIIKGDMSLVGPRPLPISEAKELKKIDPDWYLWRHQVKPGLFSLWVLDDRRHQSLKIWKQLERDTLALNLYHQYLLIFRIILVQIKKSLNFFLFND
jgi:lipopolysaccharide/colanic/teichoic acid biosynthesis glycosyltransferase